MQDRHRRAARAAGPALAAAAARADAGRVLSADERRRLAERLIRHALAARR